RRGDLKPAPPCRPSLQGFPGVGWRHSGACICRASARITPSGGRRMTQDPYHNPTPPRDAPYPGPPAETAADAAEDLQFDRAESATPPSSAAVAGFEPAAPGVA